MKKKNTPEVQRKPQASSLKPSSNLVLIGMRCTGKTAVGRLAGRRLGMRFVDSDERVVARARRSIREIFETRGEAAFRAVEADVIRELAGAERQVIATGGGVVLDPRNVEALRGNGYVIHLSASPETIYQRLTADPERADQRPALTSAGGDLREIEQVWAARAPLYEAARHAEISAETASVEDVAEQVVLLFEKAKTKD